MSELPQAPATKPSIHDRADDAKDSVRALRGVRPAQEAGGASGEVTTDVPQPRRVRRSQTDIETARTDPPDDDASTPTEPDSSDEEHFRRPTEAQRPTIRVRPRDTQPPLGESLEERRSANDLIEQLANHNPPRATKGWRALFGLKPSTKEMDEARDLAVIKTQFRRPVTVLVANPKGGSGKTPTSVLLGGAFGLNRGGGVVVWDNNELRGTLPDRTFSPHRRNIHDLLTSLEQLRWSTSQFTDLIHFLNHQDNGNYYTLGSAQDAGHVVTGQSFRQVHELFARYFQIIIVDTGNNEAAPNWTAAAGEADCLVVPTKWRKDSLIPAARMLESLQDTNPELLQRTVIAATNGPQDIQQDARDSGSSWFGSNHPIVDIPVDPHIATGGVIDHSLLSEETHRAGLRLAAEVALRLTESGHAPD